MKGEEEVLERVFERRKGVFSFEFTLNLSIAAGSSLTLNDGAEKRCILTHANPVRQFAAADTKRGFDARDLSHTKKTLSAIITPDLSFSSFPGLILSGGTKKQKPEREKRIQSNSRRKSHTPQAGSEARIDADTAAAEAVEVGVCALVVARIALASTATVSDVENMIEWKEEGKEKSTFAWPED